MTKSKGLTLVELLISTSIAVVVGGLLLTILANSSGLFYKESSKVSIGLNTNDALAKVRSSIKESSGVEDTSGSNTLVLKVPSLDKSNNIIANAFDYFIFFRDENKLRFKIFPNEASFRKIQDQIFSTDVNRLTFNYLNSSNPPAEVAPKDATKVRISLTLKQKSGTDYETSTAVSEANLRNK